MKKQTLVNKLLKLLLVAIYTAISLVIFNRVYETSKEVIDELFHVGQGLKYCHGNFSEVSLIVYIGSRQHKKGFCYFSGIRKSRLFLDSISCHLSFPLSTVTRSHCVWFLLSVRSSTCSWFTKSNRWFWIPTTTKATSMCCWKLLHLPHFHPCTSLLMSITLMSLQSRWFSWWSSFP
jgi:hypothetical protein